MLVAAGEDPNMSMGSLRTTHSHMDHRWVTTASKWYKIGGPTGQTETSIWIESGMVRN